MKFKQVFLHTAIQAIAWMAGTAAFAQQPYTITGRLGKDRQGFVHLLYYGSDGRRIQDSAAVKDGAFILAGKVGVPGMAQLILNFDAHRPMTMDYYQGLDQQGIYLEGAAYKVEGETGLKTAGITGGQAQTDYSTLKQLHKTIDAQMEEINAVVAKYKTGGGDIDMEHLKERMKPLAAQSNTIDSAFIKDHPDSYIAWELWKKKVRGSIDPAVIEPEFRHFSERIRHSLEGEKLAAQIARARKLDVGASATGFVLKDTSGKTVNLSALKGKYVLICFWQKNVYGIEGQRFSLDRVRRLYKDVYILPAALDESRDYTDMPQCLLVDPAGKIVDSRMSLGNELPSRIAKFIKPTGIAAEGDVYVGGEMVKYPQVDWIQGQAVTTFEKGKIYIVELWATWCVPCVAAMPHLNKLSQKFAGKITVIGQDVMEEDKQKVQQFVQKKGDGLTYAIAYAGGRGSDFDKKWIEPAGVMGIPQTFIIQDNKLVWQTHPEKLNEDILQLLIDNKFTIDAAEALATKN